MNRCSVRSFIRSWPMAWAYPGTFHIIFWTLTMISIIHALVLCPIRVLFVISSPKDALELVTLLIVPYLLCAYGWWVGNFLDGIRSGLVIHFTPSAHDVFIFSACDLILRFRKPLESSRPFPAGFLLFIEIILVSQPANFIYTYIWYSYHGPFASPKTGILYFSFNF